MKLLRWFPALLVALTLVARADAPLTPAIEAALTKEIAVHHAAGVVTLVMQDGKIIHHAATGLADREQKLPMKTVTSNGRHQDQWCYGRSRGAIA